ncbi:nuclear transport factor 2 family protein [Actinomadura oligospora]|uniref:nuclear transport factor 2 family protein n=1 Tax=Actinomadura oligospora TaxID=111804 RepID=UPI0004B7FECF|nr:nuclear transport factor 2 family protein [Actinomadura oligospora]
MTAPNATTGVDGDTRSATDATAGADGTTGPAADAEAGSGRPRTLRDLLDAHEVEQAVLRLGWLVDGRDWDRLTALFADTVTEDNTSLWGGEPVTEAGTALVERWRAVLSGTDASQHLITGVLSEVGDGAAVATANVVIVVRRADHLGGPLWACGGRYRMELAASAGGWRITSFTLTAAWTAGNPNVITGAPRPQEEA